MITGAAGAALAAALLPAVSGHGAIVHPRSRNAVDYAEVGCDMHTDGCSAKAVGNGCVNVTHPGEPCHNGQASFWYSQGCAFRCQSLRVQILCSTVLACCRLYRMSNLRPPQRAAPDRPVRAREEGDAA